jgi:hypothetical protein
MDATCITSVATQLQGYYWRPDQKKVADVKQLQINSFPI